MFTISILIVLRSTVSILTGKSLFTISILIGSPLYTRGNY